MKILGILAMLTSSFAFAVFLTSVFGSTGAVLACFCVLVGCGSGLFTLVINRGRIAVLTGGLIVVLAVVGIVFDGLVVGGFTFYGGLLLAGAGLMTYCFALGFCIYLFE